jgi:hypothetical protein
VIPDVSTAVLGVQWQAPGLHRVLAIYEAEIWVWALTDTAAPWAPLAGSFRTSPRSSELTDIRALGERVIAEPEVSPGQLALQMTAGAVVRNVAAASPLAAEIGHAVGPLLQRALDAPVSAIRLTGHVLTAPDGSSHLGLAFGSIGTDPATVLLAAERVAVGDDTGNWREVPPPRMGLVDAEANLLDGLYHPAVIPAGGRGVWAVSQPYEELSDQWISRVRGSIVLRGPWQAEVALQEPFEVTAPLART